MASLNQVQLIGYLGKDPEIKAMQNGDKVANISLAVTERGYKKADGTDVPEKTEWVNIVAWRKLADILQNYTHKGSMLFAQGKLRTRSYDAQDGSKRYITEVVADSIVLLDRKADNDANLNNGGTTTALRQDQNPANPQNNFHAPTNPTYQQHTQPAQQPTAPQQQRDIWGHPTYHNQQAPQQPPQPYQPEPYQPSPQAQSNIDDLPF